MASAASASSSARASSSSTSTRSSHRGQCSAINSSVRIRSGRPWVIVDTMISLAPVRSASACSSLATRRRRRRCGSTASPGRSHVGVRGRVVRVQQGHPAPGADAEHGQPGRPGEVLGRLGVVGGQRAGRDDGVRLVERRRGPERLPVQLHGFDHARQVEVVGEGERQAELPGELRRVPARAEQHDLRARRRDRRRPEPRPRRRARRARRRAGPSGRAGRGGSPRRRGRQASGAARPPSPGRCRGPARCRGRCARGAAPRAWRTARRRRAGRGWAASRRPTRP